MTEPRPKSRSIFSSLYFRVVVGLVAGVFVGIVFPHFGQQLKPLGDGFVKLVRMLVTPIIFLTVVTGIASMGDVHRLGRVGLKALIYFEVVTTFALLLGFATAHLLHPGVGMNVDPRTLDAKAVGQYVQQGHSLDVTSFLLGVLPDSYVGAFANGEILQVLLLAVFTGIALVTLDDKQRLLSFSRAASHLFFRITALVMQLAPFAVFGAMGFTIGKYGLGTLVSLAKVLLCVYLTSIGFIVIVLGGICLLNGINLWRLVVYLREELLIVIGTSSSEPALPGLIAKMERLGCPDVIAGLVIPACYSFNLDGSTLYLAMAMVFVAQVANVPLSIGTQVFMMGTLMLASKGVAGVPRAVLVVLLATAGTLRLPSEPILVLLGIDALMDMGRTAINVVGNCLASAVVARWEGALDTEFVEPAVLAAMVE